MQDYIDRSNYFRGLLIIVAKDGKISTEERNRVMMVGKKLGFEKKFCESAINEILDNEFVKIEPPKFKDINIARQFLIDGIALSYADFNFHPKEIEFLKETARVNGIEEDWFISELSKQIEK